MYDMDDAPRSQLPVKAYKAAQGPSAGSISFYYECSQRPGIRVRDILSAAAGPMMAEPDEVVIQGLKFLKLYLSWPGYASAAMVVPIECAHISKLDLAIVVSRHLTSFVEKCSSMPVSNSGIPWRVGPDAITMNSVVLVALYNTGGDVWQAEIEIES
ncbi:hypothetical protein DFH11DRAFT_438175 [Phellopilus nigrolimitatus]|nr:hypothetical protein DFH11DRAFT_438175 [Phellopilus nigrolimitatus]